MNTRLKQFMAAENITQSQLADSLNVVRASVSHILSGRNNPSYEFIKALMSRYPKLNMEWLMFGKGKMYSNVPEPQEEQLPPAPERNQQEEILFSGEDDSISIFSDATLTDSAQNTTPDANTEATTDINTLHNLTQLSGNKRKVVKVTILFDDGTYQEL